MVFIKIQYRFPNKFIFEYKRPIYAESNQKIEIAIINTARIKPGIAIPINAIKILKNNLKDCICELLNKVRLEVQLIKQKLMH